MVANFEAMKQIFDEAREWRQRATWGSTDGLTPAQLKYRKEFWDQVRRCEEKYGADYERAFGGA